MRCAARQFALWSLIWSSVPCSVSAATGQASKDVQTIVDWIAQGAPQ
jgi:hypothetical protein